MAYPDFIKEFTIKIDKNASGYYIGPEYFNVPAAPPYELYLDHVPKDEPTTTIGASGGAPWTPPADYEVDYVYGKVTFAAAKAGLAAEAMYDTLGDDIMAEHINSLQEEVVSLEGQLWPSPGGAYDTVAERLNAIDVEIDTKMGSASGIPGQWIIDDTIRAGALMDDIKGSSWATVGRPTLTTITDHIIDTAEAHVASAIYATAPGTTAIANVQQHINQKGSVDQSPSNPHGMALEDLSGSFIGVVNYDILQADWIGISGNRLSMDINGPEVDQWVDFYNAGAAATEWIRWNTGDNVFEFSSPAVWQGGITASGNLMPEASGARYVGTAAEPFSYGNFDTIQAGSFVSGESTGTTGFFTTNDGKTVTVQNGLIVSIV